MSRVTTALQSSKLLKSFEMPILASMSRSVMRRVPSGSETEFLQFVGDLRDVGPEVVGEHRERLGVDLHAAAADELLQPRRDLVVARPHRFEDHAVGRTPLVEGRTLVDILLLVADDEDRRGGGFLRVEREFVEVLELLGLLDDDHLVLAHHGHLAAEVHDLPGVRVAAVDGDLVEGPGGLVEDRRGELFGHGVDEVSLLAHQQVDAGEFPGGDFAREPFVLGDRVLEFQRAFGHVRRSLW